MIEHFVQRASSYAGRIDGLFTLVTVLVGFWFIVAELTLFYFIIRFRRRKGRKARYITGEEKQQKRWINIPHALVLVCDVVIVAAAIQVWYLVKQKFPEPDKTIRVIAQQWAWTFVHPGPDGQLDTADDIATVDALHVQTGTVYHFKLESRDVVHSFSVPVFRLKQDAVPGRVITGWFEPTRTGRFDIQCAEICGIGHGLMVADLVIETPEEHAQWMARPTPAGPATRLTLAREDEPR